MTSTGRERGSGLAPSQYGNSFSSHRNGEKTPRRGHLSEAYRSTLDGLGRTPDAWPRVSLGCSARIHIPNLLRLLWYSDMAVGLGHMFAVRLPQNFNSPYKATDPTDFWRRWHMTLSSWLRDYLYIPLGGNRNGKQSAQPNDHHVSLGACGMARLGCLFSGVSGTACCWRRSTS